MTHSGLCVSSVSPGGASEGETLSDLIFHGASLTVCAWACVCVRTSVCIFSSPKQRNETIKYSTNEPGTVSKAHACLECNTVGHRDRHTNRSLWRKIWARSSVKRQIQILAFNYKTSWLVVVVLLRKKRNQRVLMCIKHVGWLPIASHKLFRDFKVSASSQSLRNLSIRNPVPF